MKKLIFTALAVLGASTAMPASAALTLTAQAVTNGFTLSTFYSDPNSYYGVLQATTTPDGHVIATNYTTRELRRFNNVDGQTYTSALNSATINFGSGVPGYGAVSVGGKVYYASGFGGGYYEVDQTTLALTPLALTTPTTPYLGLWANQITGHLLSSSYSGLVDINPLTGVVKVVTTETGFDGVTVSSDGTKVYGALSASGGTIKGFDIATGAVILNAVVGHGLDGTGMISGSTFNGYIVAVNNDGTLGLIDPATGIETVIATGGARGDFAGVDLINGQLFASYSDQTYRIGIKGGVIGGGGPVPEPAAWMMMIVGFGLAGTMLRRGGTRFAVA